MSSIESLREAYNGSGHLSMILRFHALSATCTEWEPVLLAEVLEHPEKYPEIIEVIVPEFASMKLLGEI